MLHDLTLTLKKEYHLKVHLSDIVELLLTF